MLEDLGIVDSSLAFINDLLRNMLDFNKTSSQDVKLRLSSIDINTDILQVVESLLYTRGRNYTVITECPDNLVVQTDPLRLKQILFNVSSPCDTARHTTLHTKLTSSPFLACT